MPLQATSVYFLQESHRFPGVATILNPLNQEHSCIGLIDLN